jgi:hypothetical protein
LSQKGLPAGHGCRFTMKRTFTLGLAVLAGVAVFAGLVDAALRLAHVAQPAAVTVQGATNRRLWATGAVGLGLVGAIMGGLAWARPSGRFGNNYGRVGALACGVIATINGSLVLAVANGGPGSGNGVAGGAAALILGVIGIGFGGWALGRARTL